MFPLITCRHLRLFLSFMLAACATASLRAGTVPLDQATIADIQAAYRVGTLSAEQLTERYLARIAAFDAQGPRIHTVLTLNPRALEEARTLDAERKAGKSRGPLHGIPIVLKDNFDTFDLPTTAGSQLLEGSIPPDDAFVVKRLRAAGAIILAKVNLSEFAAGGGSVSGASDPAILEAGAIPNGSSTLAQTLNPHDLARGPAGSSGGTGAAVAATFAQFGLGSDTAGSVRGPSAANGIVGLKTTLGLVSRDGVVPLALSFDTVGPMARSVYDVAAALTALAGSDRADASTRGSDRRRAKDYTTFLKTGALKGARIGVARDLFGRDPETQRIIEAAIVKLRSLGAEIVDPITFPAFVQEARQPLYVLIRNSEFKAQIADYLRTLKSGYPRTLEELIAKADDPKTGYRSPQKLFALKYTAAQAVALDDPLYLAARDSGVAMVKAGVQAVFTTHRLDAIIYPAAAQPAGLIQPRARAGGGGPSAATIANMSGFPDLVVPAGLTADGLPVGLSFLGPAYSEPKLLGYGFDFEQATKARVLPKHTPALAADTLTF